MDAGRTGAGDIHARLRDCPRGTMKNRFPSQGGSDGKLIVCVMFFFCSVGGGGEIFKGDVEGDMEQTNVPCRARWISEKEVIFLVSVI